MALSGNSVKAGKVSVNPMGAVKINIRPAIA
jgi:hypothetical protein